MNKIIYSLCVINEESCDISSIHSAYEDYNDCLKVKNEWEDLEKEREELYGLRYPKYPRLCGPHDKWTKSTKRREKYILPLIKNPKLWKEYEFLNRDTLDIISVEFFYESSPRNIATQNMGSADGTESFSYRY
jgi:hypothetical protein